jgi:hypothetical protein
VKTGAPRQPYLGEPGGPAGGADFRAQERRQIAVLIPMGVPARARHHHADASSQQAGNAQTGDRQSPVGHTAIITPTRRRTPATTCGAAEPHAIIRAVAPTEPLDLPTAAALVRLRLLAEDARVRAQDTSDAGQHLALIALDGACEHALWLAAHTRNVAVPRPDRASVPDLYVALRDALGDAWQIRGWPGVSQMHQARNAAQHAGIVHDLAQLPNWRDATVAFIDSLMMAAFSTRLDDILLAGAVRDPGLRRQLEWSEETLPDDPARCLSLALGAFDQARERWREQRRQQWFTPPQVTGYTATGLDIGFASGSGVREQLAELDDFLEVQLFAGDAGEYVWLRRARIEQSSVGWMPAAQEARRALLFVTGWIVRWEIFDAGYPAERWESHRESIQPPVVGDGVTPQILGAHVDLQKDVPGLPARHVVYLQLANVPNRGRPPWETLLGDALTECSRDAGAPGLLAESQWYISGFLILHVTLGHDGSLVGDVADRAVTLAAQRYGQQVSAAADRAKERNQLERALCALVHSARSDELGLFGDVSVVTDEWLGTGGFLAFLTINVGDRGREELNQTHDIFGNARAAFPNLHEREGHVVFSISELTSELDAALRTAIADSEAQARHVREHRARQARESNAFAAAIHTRFGPLPEQ